MTPLIDRLERDGLQFHLDAKDGLRWKYRRHLTPEERTEVATHRDELVRRAKRGERSLLPTRTGDRQCNLDYHRDSEELELFASILTSIELSREYSRLFPQVAKYLRRELTPEHFRILELAYSEVLIARRGVSC